ncbi:MAG: DUF1684 domain-containing protein [Halanaeroarchaeum sp.]
MSDDFDEDAWRDRIRAHRSEKDRAFRSDPALPTPNGADFEGLSYFPLDPAYRLTARVQWVRDPQTVALSANSGPPIEYERVATFGFTLHDAHRVLAGFRSPGTADVLIPFNDETNGSETAGEGRYLVVADLEDSTQTEAVLDFNLAYHPFCVYDGYVSALPPDENDLDTGVRAGERL